GGRRDGGHAGTDRRRVRHGRPGAGRGAGGGARAPVSAAPRGGSGRRRGAAPDGRGVAARPAGAVAVRINVVTIFPAYFGETLRTSILGRAAEADVARYRVIDLRDYTHDRHRTVDDEPYGGGAGMVMKPEP